MFFIDPNVFVYAFLEPENEADRFKHLTANNLLNSIKELNVFISIQVLNEFYNTLLRYGIGNDKIRNKIDQIISVVQIASLTLNTVKKCWGINEKYKFSYYDSLIIASALENGCNILYTEDMQHSQVIEDSLKIINPFKESER